MTIMVTTTLVMSYPDKRDAVCMPDNGEIYFENPTTTLVLKIYFTIVRHANGIPFVRI
jgi:hypothetical protein